jgi:hypothetical protein
MGGGGALRQEKPWYRTGTLILTTAQCPYLLQPCDGLELPDKHALRRSRRIDPQMCQARAMPRRGNATCWQPLPVAEMPHWDAREWRGGCNHHRQLGRGRQTMTPTSGRRVRLVRGRQHECVLQEYACALAVSRRLPARLYMWCNLLGCSRSSANCRTHIGKGYCARRWKPPPPANVACGYDHGQPATVRAPRTGRVAIPCTSPVAIYRWPSIDIGIILQILVGVSHYAHHLSPGRSVFRRRGRRH